MKNPIAISCNVSCRAGDQSVHKAASVPFIVHSTMGGSTQKWELMHAVKYHIPCVT